MGISENFITIKGWMITELGLSGNKLTAYALIYGFSQDGKSEYTGSLTYLQEWLRCSRPTAINTLKSLVSDGFIIKRSESKNNITFNSYSANLQLIEEVRGGKKTLPPVKNLNGGGKNSLQGGGKKTLPNNNIYNNNINNNNTVFSFEEFWEMYPIKKNKDTAKKKYKNIPEKERQKIKDTLPHFIEHKEFPGYKHPHPTTYINQKRWNDEIKTSSLKNNFTEKQLLARWAAARKHYDNNTAEITILKPEDAEMFERLKETYTAKDFDQAMVGFFSQESKYPQMRIQPSHFLKNFEMYLHLFRSGGKLYGGTKDRTKLGML